MADENAIANLLTQIAYLQGGGKPQGQRDVDKLNSIFSGVTTDVGNMQAIIKNSLEAKKQQIENAPLYKNLGLPSAQDEASQASQIQGQTQAASDFNTERNNRMNQQSQNIYQQAQQQQGIGPLTEDQNAGVNAGVQAFGKTLPPPSTYPSPFVSQRQASGIPDSILNAPTSIAKEVSNIRLLQNAQRLYINPFDRSDVSLFPDATHTIKADVKTALPGLATSKQPGLVQITASDQDQKDTGGNIISGEKYTVKNIEDAKSLYRTQIGGQRLEPLVQQKAITDIENRLPSEMGATTVPGAASGIQMSARQLMALIADPGSYQRLGLSKSDLARIVMRSAPQEEAMKNAGFSNTLINSVNVLKQKLTSNPDAIDQPLIRQEIYNIASDLERSSKPVIQRQLAQTYDAYKNMGRIPPNWDTMAKRELGDIEYPVVPFQFGNANPAQQIQTATNPKTGQKVKSMDGGQTWQPIK